MAQTKTKVRFIGSHRHKRRTKPPYRRHGKSVSGRRPNKK